MAYTTIDDPSAYFQALVYAGTGNSASQPTTHTNDGNSDLQPDLFWVKDRGAGYGHALVDSTRGRSKYLFPDGVNAEVTTGSTAYDVVSFDSNGFKVGAPSEANSTNGGTTSKVAWQWKANAGTTTAFTESGNNPGGTRQTNTAAGFSIISYTGTGAPGNIAHGLPSAPEWIIFKNRGTTNVWATWHQAIGDDVKLVLNTTAAIDADGSFMNSTLPDATNIRVGDSGNPNTNADAGTYMCYAWSPIQGYSKFGSYVGNGNADGTFIYTGFKPAFIMVKTTLVVDEWNIYDTKRSGFNFHNDALYASSSVVEDAGSTYAFMDIVSNGFKLRRATYSPNKSSTYIYMAFAENPFVTSTGVPTTAR